MSDPDPDVEQERRIMFSHLGGYSGGIEHCERMVRSRAADMFAAGQDEPARLMRNLANDLKQEATKARKKQQEYT